MYVFLYSVLQSLFHYILTDDKPLNGEETADSENLANEEEEAAANTCYYDKSKSFFDNLSCDDSRYLSLFYTVILDAKGSQFMFRLIIAQMDVKKRSVLDLKVDVVQVLLHHDMNHLLVNWLIVHVPRFSLIR